MKHALMPHHSRPKFIDGHPHWIVRSADGARLATLYTSDINGHGADFSAEVGGTLTCRVVPGSPCLPLTNPGAVPHLAWADVAAEVGAMLAADGWTVCWPVSDPVTDAPVWGDQEADFFDAVADHAYAEGRTDSVRDFTAERDALRARAEAAEAKAKQAADDHDFLARQIGAAAVASTLAPGESLVREPGETRHVIVGVVERLVARAHTAEATAARLSAANVRLMRRLGPALGAWKAAADELAKMGRRAVEAEAALATARAEGAAAERAAVVEWLHSQVSQIASAGYLDLAWAGVAVEHGAHVRPVEGA